MKLSLSAAFIIALGVFAPDIVSGAPQDWEEVSSTTPAAPALHGRTGCELEPGKGCFKISYVATMTPASRAGIQAGDTVTAIDDVPAGKMTYREALGFMNGRVGGIVSLTFHHEGGTDQHANLTRQSFVDVYTPAADSGDAQAQFLLGYYYNRYSPAPNHYELAEKWLRKAADQGHPKAETDLGYFYAYGLGVPQDAKEAASWYLKAAQQDDAVAEQLLGELYTWGHGVPQSDGDAFKWYYRSAQQDNAKGECSLGYAYQTGHGVEKNDHAAFAWYYRSAIRGNAYGAWGLSYMYETGRGVPRNLTEAYRWIRVAQAGLPQNLKIRKSAAILSLAAFAETRDFESVDVSLLLSAFHTEIVFGFAALAFIYIAIGVSLLAYSLLTSRYPPPLLSAFGWATFLVESQFVALLSVVLFAKTLSADLLIIAIVVFGALPIVISSFGKTRRQIWRSTSANWRFLLLSICGAYLAFIAVSVTYNFGYRWITGVELPAQPTLALIGKAKDASAWVAYTSVALALPLAEEVLFRGYFFDALRRRFSGLFVVIATAFGFSLYHCQPLYILPLFCFGLILGWVKLKADSLLPCVAIHVLTNALTLTFGV